MVIWPLSSFKLAMSGSTARESPNAPSDAAAAARSAVLFAGFPKNAISSVTASGLFDSPSAVIDRGSLDNAAINS
jgi:hypothetical protein